MSKNKSYPFPVWSGLLEHRAKMGPAIWEFLWCLDKITTETDGVGWVLGKQPVKAARIAKDLKDESSDHLRQPLTTGTVRLHHSDSHSLWFPDWRASISEVWNLAEKRCGDLSNSHPGRCGENSNSDFHRCGVFRTEMWRNLHQRCGDFSTNKEDTARNTATRQGKRKRYDGFAVASCRKENRCDRGIFGRDLSRIAGI